MEGTIEVDDTVRWIGKRQRWIVNAIDGDTLTVWTSSGNPRRGVHEITRDVDRGRVELVRKGNRIDDAVAAYDARVAAESN